MVDRTICSNIPPHQGAFSRLKLHCRPIMLLYCFTSGCVNTSYIAFAADLKVLPLSDTILCGNPLLEVKRLKHRRKASTVMFGTMSRCTALTTQHVYKHIHTFFSVTSRDAPILNISIGADIAILEIMAIGKNFYPFADK